jgi:hypothetical protein
MNVDIVISVPDEQIEALMHKARNGSKQMTPDALEARVRVDIKRLVRSKIQEMVIQMIHEHLVKGDGK